MDELDLRIVESICCVRCGAQCEEEQVGDLLRFTCTEDHTVHLLTVKAPTEAVPPAGDDPLIGQTLGPCRVVRPAGVEGGLPIYHGLHVSLNHPHIVRAITGEAARDRTRLQDFVQAARFAAAVRHGAIANVVHLGKLDGGLFCVSAPLEGQPLAAVLDGPGRLPVRDSLRVARSLADALAGLHAKGIVHRNLGPRTVYLTPAGGPLLCNFAFAIGPDRPADAGVVAGQAGYLAPEQAMGRATDARADLYSLGALLYALITGRAPFSGSDASDVIRNQIAGKLPERGPLAAAAPPALTKLVLSLLAANPGQRPADARAVLDTLAAAEGQFVAPAAPAQEAVPTPDLAALGIDEGQLSIVEPDDIEPEPFAPSPALPKPPRDKPKPSPTPLSPHAKPGPKPPKPKPSTPDDQSSFSSSLEFGPAPTPEPEQAQPEAPGLAGPELPEPDEAPRRRPKGDAPSGVLGELVFSADDVQEAAAHASAEPHLEVVSKPSFIQKNMRAVVLLGIVAVVGIGYFGWSFFGGSKPEVIRPRPKPTTRKGGGPRPGPKPETADGPKKPTPADKLAREADEELPKIAHFADKNPNRYEEIVKRCDEFLKKYSATPAAEKVYEIRKGASAKLREIDSERELRDIANFARSREKPYTERLAAMDALLAKYGDLTSEKGLRALAGAKKQRDEFVRRAQEEAKRLFESWTSSHEKELERKEYGRALAELEKIVAEHAGTEDGDKAAARLKALKTDIDTAWTQIKAKAEELVAAYAFDEAVALFDEPIKGWKIEARQQEAEILVGTLRTRRETVVKQYGKLLATYDKLAQECRFADALAQTQKAAAAAEEPALKALLEGKAAEAQLLVGTLPRIVAGAKAQQAALKPGEKLWLELGRSRFKGSLANPTPDGVEIDTPMKKGKVAWGELSRAQLISFATSAKPEPKALDHLAFGLLALTGNEIAAACEQFGKALDADKTVEAPLVAALRRGAAAMVHVPEGDFLAGQQKNKKELPGYLIGAREVSNAEFALFVRLTDMQAPPQWRGGKYLRGHDEYPVTEITWQEAAGYAAWLGMRLPAADEWEKAARGTDGRTYPWGEEFTRARATIIPDEIFKDTKRMARYRPRMVRVARARLDDLPRPLYHIVGNAREWSATAVGAGREADSYFVLGGSAADSSAEARLFDRTHKQPAATRDPFTGFRLAWPR